MGHLRDIHNWMNAPAALLPQILCAAVANGVTADRRGFNSVEHLVIFGAATDTLSANNHYMVRVEESANGSVWTVVTNSDHLLAPNAPDAEGTVFDVNSNAKAGLAYRVGYQGNQPYSRVVVEGEGAVTTGIMVAAANIQMHPSQFPVAAPATA